MRTLQVLPKEALLSWGCLQRKIPPLASSDEVSAYSVVQGRLRVAAWPEQWLLEQPELQKPKELRELQEHPGVSNSI